MWCRRTNKRYIVTDRIGSFFPCQANFSRVHLQIRLSYCQLDYFSSAYVACLRPLRNHLARVKVKVAPNRKMAIA